jgi:hypothetical protein
VQERKLRAKRRAKRRELLGMRPRHPLPESQQECPWSNPVWLQEPRASARRVPVPQPESTQPQLATRRRPVSLEIQPALRMQRQPQLSVLGFSPKYQLWKAFSRPSRFTSPREWPWFDTVDTHCPPLLTRGFWQHPCGLTTNQAETRSYFSEARNGTRFRGRISAPDTSLAKVALSWKLPGAPLSLPFRDFSFKLLAFSS